MTDGMPMSITFPQSRAGTDGKHARMGSSHRVWDCLGHEGGQPPTPIILHLSMSPFWPKVWLRQRRSGTEHQQIFRNKRGDIS